MDDMIYRWTDGTWCHREDLSEYLAIKSDDYEAFTSKEFFSNFPEENNE